MPIPPGLITVSYTKSLTVQFQERQNNRTRKKIVDSLRWEMLRETAEDYDTLYLLERAGGNSKEFAQLVKGLSGSEEDPKSFYCPASS